VNSPNTQATTTALTSSLNPSTAGQQVTFTAVVSEAGSSEAPAGTVTFTIDGQAETPVPLAVVGGLDQAQFPISTLTVGKYSISATYNGNGTFATSTLVTPLRQTVDGQSSTPVSMTKNPVSSTNPSFPTSSAAPTVVLLQRFGVHMHPTVVVLTFSSALDPTTAEDVRNYRIVGPAGRRIAINSAVYDSTSNTVTLHPHKKINLHHNYQLTVIGIGPGGVASVSDTLLDGAGDGDPGSTYVATLNWKNVVLTPAEIAKYIKPKSAKPAGALAHRFVSRSR
jgi:Bacterial Ig-like domain (group 3)